MRATVLCLTSVLIDCLSRLTMLYHVGAVWRMNLPYGTVADRCSATLTKLSDVPPRLCYYHHGSLGRASAQACCRTRAKHCVVLWISPGLARPKTLSPLDFGTKSTYKHSHMVKINSSYVKILNSFLQSSHNSVYEEFSIVR